jgi:hypothetical protein
MPMFSFCAVPDLPPEAKVEAGYVYGYGSKTGELVPDMHCPPAPAYLIYARLPRPAYLRYGG